MNSKLESREDFGRFLNNLQLNQYGVELGVAQGYFSESLLENSNLKILFSIDRWTDHHDYDEYLVAKEKLSKYNGRSVILKLKFKDAVKLFDDEIFDFIYIDGYAHTGQDNGIILKDWWPKLKPNGIFAGHDYCIKTYPKTVEQVDKFATRHQLKLNFTKEKEYTSWYCIKEKK